MFALTERETFYMFGSANPVSCVHSAVCALIPQHCVCDCACVRVAILLPLYRLSVRASASRRNPVIYIWPSPTTQREWNGTLKAPAFYYPPTKTLSIRYVTSRRFTSPTTNHSRGHAASMSAIGQVVVIVGYRISCWRRPITH